MKKRIYKILSCIIAFSLLSLVLSSCDLFKTSESFTLLIYMCGSDLESERGYATKNISEILSADIAENVNIVIQTGGTKEWKSYDIPSDSLNRYTVKDNELVFLETTHQASMGDPETLSDFVSWGTKKYPSDNYGIVLWNHGGGSPWGVCFDENFDDDVLTLSELDTALCSAEKSISDKFEFIGFDACLMANYETASIVSKYSRHMIASEENEPAGGWDYKVLAENLSKDSFYQSLLSGYAEKCRLSDKETFTLSVFDLNGFDKIKQDFDLMISKLDTMNLTSVVKSAQNSISFGINAEEIYTNLIDMGQFASAVGCTQLEDSISDYIMCQNGEYRSNAGGLSFYYPLKDMSSVDAYMDIADESYRNFLKKNYTTTNDEFISVTGIEDKDGRLFVTVSPESVNHIVSASYHLLQLETENNKQTAFVLGEDTDITFDGVNGYTVNFKGYWVTFGGEFIHFHISEDDEKYTKYSSPVKVNGKDCDMRFVYDKKSYEIVLEGYVEVGDAAGRIMDFADNDVVTLLYNDDDESSGTLKEGKSITFSEDVILEVALLPVGNYQYTVKFSDVYGDEYQAGTANTYFDGKNMKIISIDDNSIDYDL